MVLGELIEEESGKITGQRVLDVEGPKMETSFKMNGKFGGIEGSDIGTYCTVMREGSEPGVMYGEGQGVITTKDGQGMATWTGQGIGRFTAPGKISFRGSVFYRTTQLVEERYHFSITLLVFSNTKWTSRETLRLKCGNGSNEPLLDIALPRVTSSILLLKIRTG